MLSPSSHVLKDTSEEDSSGSDAGLEPETDRFGFIVTDGSTAGSSSSSSSSSRGGVGPSPELVRQREAKWINIMVHWDRIVLKRSNKVKVQCQKGIPASLRAKCWPLLCGATAREKQNKDLYQHLDSQAALQSWVDVINRDLDRQFPFHEMFLSKDGHGQRGLFRVLKAYTQYKPEEGYCQAQGPVAAVLLMNMPVEEAFWCLVQISEQYLPGYYSPLLEGVLFDAAILNWVLKRMCPPAHKHLEHYGVEPLMFATDWLMCLFTRHLPFNALLRVWDLFFCYGVRVLLQVAVVLVRRVLGRAEQRKKCEGQMETLEKLRSIREHVQEEADAFIAEVCSVPLSARDLEKQMEKEMEKWKRDRPSSTFEPRHRCTGYQMVWAVALQNQQTREKMERETGHLSVPLTRSVSTLSLSLSLSLSPKRWRKGGKVSAGEREAGARITRHRSMGAKDQRWIEVNFKPSKCVHEDEDEDVETQEPIDEKETEKHSEEEPRSPEMDGSLTREKSENKKQTEETKFTDLTGNHQQPEGQSHAPEHNCRIDAQDETQKHLDENPEPEMKEKVRQSQGDTEKRPHWDTVTEEAENTVQEKRGSTAEVDGLVQTQEDLEPSEHLHSKTEVGEVLVSDHTGSEPSETSVLCFKATEAIQENVEISLTENAGAEKDETSTEITEITERTPELDTDDNPPDGKMSSVQTSPPEEPAPEPPEVPGTAGEGRSMETSEGNTVENHVFDSVKHTEPHNEPPGGEVRNSLTQASSRRSSRSSSDFCIRKSSSSQGSRLGRSLSEDLFTVPQKPSQPPSMESNSGVKPTEPLSNPSGANSLQSTTEVSSVRSLETSRTDQQQETPNPLKGFGLLRKLRGQAPKHPKGPPKFQVPKILIQDFSDGMVTEKPIQEYREEKLNSRERRRRQREQERRTKEEEKLRKKREKEQEKVTEREKRKTQTLGKNVQVQGGKERCNELHPAKHHSHRRKSSTSYAESYF